MDVNGERQGIFLSRLNCAITNTYVLLILKMIIHVTVRHNESKTSRFVLNRSVNVPNTNMAASEDHNKPAHKILRAANMQEQLCKV